MQVIDPKNVSHQSKTGKSLSKKTCKSSTKNMQVIDPKKMELNDPKNASHQSNIGKSSIQKTTSNRCKSSAKKCHSSSKPKKCMSSTKETQLAKNVTFCWFYIYI